MPPRHPGLSVCADPNNLPFSNRAEQGFENAQNVRGYSIYGDYSKEAPPSDLPQALGADEIDVAIACKPY